MRRVSEDTKVLGMNVYVSRSSSATISACIQERGERGTLEGRGKRTWGEERVRRQKSAWGARENRLRRSWSGGRITVFSDFSTLTLLLISNDASTDKRVYTHTSFPSNTIIIETVNLLMMMARHPPRHTMSLQHKWTHVCIINGSISFRKNNRDVVITGGVCICLILKGTLYQTLLSKLVSALKGAQLEGNCLCILLYTIYDVHYTNLSVINICELLRVFCVGRQFPNANILCRNYIDRM